MILVTGGAGYIGSHTVRRLRKKGYDVVVYDNLSKGHRWAVKDAELVVGDILDYARVCEVIKKYGIDSVIHFAAHSLVGESMQDPQMYYVNNVSGTISLLRAMINCGIKKIVFSSTAAVYGEPEEVPIKEDSRLNPTNVYGRTKLMIENILRDYDMAYGLKYVALRYFNAAGADDKGDIGEDHTPETHLIPLVLKAAKGEREDIKIFGTDYNTPDGTCIRDYIHVNDLADAHVLALESLREGRSNVYNLGNGSGFSVKQVIEVAEKVTGKSIKKVESDRRPGDPAVLIASSEKIRRELGWKPVYTDLEKIIQTAWNWELNKGVNM
ncbi:UDP-glucose 4-epimerase [Caldanaerobius fijiensis DSM 17918]|uniref:UDP-glucose 4-epimerase n=1 Tax=Caldanaerobius fijiensis DSM 17918 TaxID=1121256 RepID=A0A1M5BSK3_9THEO|nr:UDP-glucose 4-epimerase GalE [Caldanaerobius fijiensis]SHF45380.1 UDP-glucose 4-epimerase [Caldanaerobius fijiensis DSM 17918]